MLNRAIVCAALLALAVSPGFAQQDANCRAISAIEVKVRSGGDCTISTSGYCTASAESRNDYVEAFDQWFGKTGNGWYDRCSEGAAKAAAKAVATAVAKVYTNAYIGIECTYGTQGTACGWSLGQGDAWAAATAKAVANAFAEVVGDNTDAYCYADVEAISVVVADVAAKALEDGCVNGGGRFNSFTESRQEALQTGIAKAFARAFAKGCSAEEYGWAKAAVAESKCTGKASSSTEGETTSQGDGFAKGGQVDGCVGYLLETCCAQGRSGCQCPSSYSECKSRFYSKAGGQTYNSAPIYIGVQQGDKCHCG